MTHLDVLVLESHPGNADREAAALAEAGHRVHRCHEPGATGFPCVAVADPSACPIEGGVDVALAVRRLAAHPTDLEQGMTCAIRAGVPVVEDGPAVLDPFEPYLAARAIGGIVEACDDAAEESWVPLRDSVVDKTRGVLASAGIAPEDVTITFRRTGTNLHVHFDGPPADASVRHALGVRVLDAIRSGRRTFGFVDVSYGEADPA